MAHTLTIDAVGNALGQFCVDHSNIVNLDLKQGLEFENMLGFVSCEKSYQGHDVSTTSLLQPYQKGFTPNNSESHSGELSMLEKGKVDITVDIDNLEQFWDKWNCNWFQAGKDENEWDYTRWIMQNVVNAQVEEDLNIASFKGVVAAVATPGTPGALLDTFTGYEKRIADAIVDGKLVPKTVGTIGAATAVAQFKGFCNDLGDRYRERAGTIYCSKAVARLYSEDYQDKNPRYVRNISQPDQLHDMVDTYNKKVVGLDCMAGSNRLICVFDNLEGLIVGTRTGYPIYPQYRVFTDVREIKITAEIYRFFNAETFKHMFVSDVA